VTPAVTIETETYTTRVDGHEETITNTVSETLSPITESFVETLTTTVDGHVETYTKTIETTVTPVTETVTYDTIIFPSWASSPKLVTETETITIIPTP
jgi:hypothetical protein